MILCINEAVIFDDDDAFLKSDIVVDLGCDSLDIINLFFQIEEAFSITISEQDIEKYELSKVCNLVDYIQRQSS